MEAAGLDTTQAAGKARAVESKANRLYNSGNAEDNVAAYLKHIFAIYA